MKEYAADLEDVRTAARRLAGSAHRTPVLTCATLDRLAGRALFFKGEHLQKAGAFKFRGACNAVRKLTPEVAGRGVVTHSSGNHAQALALAARLRGIPAHVVMPSNASPVKRRAVEEYGGRVIECAPTLAGARQPPPRCWPRPGPRWCRPTITPTSSPARGPSPWNSWSRWGRSMPWWRQWAAAAWWRACAWPCANSAPAVRVFAAEPAGADDAARSQAAGKRIPQTGPRTIADGLLTSLGELTWPVLRDRVERVLTVSEEEIAAAMRLAWERAKLLIEPSAAVALAVVLTDEFRALPRLGRVGVVLSGGNVNLDRLPWGASSP